LHIPNAGAQIDLKSSGAAEDAAGAFLNNDQTFRILLLGMGLVVVPLGIYYRLRAQATRETLDRRQEGLFILATLRPLGIVTMVGLIAYLVDPASMAWSSIRLPQWSRWMGVSICGMAGALFIWTLRCLGKNLTDTVVTRREHTLVKHGPYRWVRHPFYSSVALFILGVSMLAANWFLLLIGGLVLMLLVIRTRIEEEKLLGRFGEGYRSYMECTGRFIPMARTKRRGG
jgi:protein-S-isoprenylcysteine O-methyltransferase Ste14